MEGRISIRYLQEYIRAKGHHPDRRDDYFLKRCCGIDLERWIPVKETLNNEKYATGVHFQLDQ